MRKDFEKKFTRVFAKGFAIILFFVCLQLIISGNELWQLGIIVASFFISWVFYSSEF